MKNQSLTGALLHESYPESLAAMNWKEWLNQYKGSKYKTVDGDVTSTQRIIIGKATQGLISDIRLTKTIKPEIETDTISFGIINSKTSAKLTLKINFRRLNQENKNNNIIYQCYCDVNINWDQHSSSQDKDVTGFKQKSHEVMSALINKKIHIIWYDQTNNRVILSFLDFNKLPVWSIAFEAKKLSENSFPSLLMKVN